MNEPSVFSGPEITMPKSNLHGSIEHRDLHNIYGMYMHKSTYKGLMKRSGDMERPFILTRAFFAGTQRYGAIWTGDNAAKWEFLEYSVPMCLSVTVGGISFCGSDVAGFFGDPSVELLVRWYQTGAYTPFFRAHAHIETKRREPWLYGEPYLSRIRDSIRERYALLPYWYSLFFQYRNNGVPVMRPMFSVYPQDNQAAALDRQYHLGPALLVAPIIKSNQDKVDVYIPEGKWYDYHTFATVEIGELKYQTVENWIPVFIKGGNIVPRQDRPRRSSQMMINDPYTLVIALDEKEAAEGILYADDTHTNLYLKGQFLLGRIEFREKTLVYQVQSKMSMHNSIEKIIILGLKDKPKSAIAETEKGSSRVGFYDMGSHIILKLPPVFIDENWTIKLNY
ncbi:unnamed protein product [Blepharisma stoltei]|uniref:Uncharacterized protein n=1 Tax=Blepharisma stoltei TaxID=1481888 RepID=A0AAU9ILL4_9CILI|nr:unnamed protein product [Blepharisma stoltei]